MLHICNPSTQVETGGSVIQICPQYIVSLRPLAAHQTTSQTKQIYQIAGVIDIIDRIISVAYGLSSTFIVLPAQLQVQDWILHYDQNWE